MFMFMFIPFFNFGRRATTEGKSLVPMGGYPIVGWLDIKIKKTGSTIQDGTSNEICATSH